MERHTRDCQNLGSKLNYCIRITVLIILYSYTTYLVYDGPIKNWLRDSTVIRKNILTPKGKHAEF